MPLDPRGEQIRLDEAEHRYYVRGLHGAEVELPGIHRVLAEDSRLLDDALATYGHSPEAALRGSYAHEAIALALTGRLDRGSLDPALAGYVEAAEAYVRDGGWTVEHVEVLAWSEQRHYATRLDAVVRRGGARATVNWKTGDAAAAHIVQAAAERAILLEEHTGPTCGLLVYVAADGGYAERRLGPPRESEAELAAEAWRGILAARRLRLRGVGGSLRPRRTVEQDERLILPSQDDRVLGSTLFREEIWRPSVDHR